MPGFDAHSQRKRQRAYDGDQYNDSVFAEMFSQMSSAVRINCGVLLYSRLNAVSFHFFSGGTFVVLSTQKLRF